MNTDESDSINITSISYQSILIILKNNRTARTTNQEDFTTCSPTDQPMALWTNHPTQGAIYSLRFPKIPGGIILKAHSQITFR